MYKIQDKYNLFNLLCKYCNTKRLNEAFTGGACWRAFLQKARQHVESGGWRNLEFPPIQIFRQAVFQQRESEKTVKTVKTGRSKHV